MVMKISKTQKENIRFFMELAVSITAILGIFLAIQANIKANKANEIALNANAISEKANQLANDANKQSEEANQIALKSITADVSVVPAHETWMVAIIECKLPESDLWQTSFNVNEGVTISNKGGAPTSIEKIEILYRVEKNTYLLGSTIFRLSSASDENSLINLPIYLPPGQALNIQLKAQSLTTLSNPTSPAYTSNDYFNEFILRFYLIDDKTIQLNLKFFDMELETPNAECWSQ